MFGVDPIGDIHSKKFRNDACRRKFSNKNDSSRWKCSAQSGHKPRSSFANHCLIDHDHVNRTTAYPTDRITCRLNSVNARSAQCDLQRIRCIATRWPKHLANKQNICASIDLSFDSLKLARTFHKLTPHLTNRSD